MRTELVRDLDETENILVWLEDKPDDVTMIRLMRTVFRILYHILTYIIRRDRRESRF